MSTPPKALVNLVEAIVPQTRRDEHLREKLVQHSYDITSSNLGYSGEGGIPNVADNLKRHLQHNHPDPAAPLRFSNLLTRLIELPLLSRKEAALRLLHSLATTSSSASARNPSLHLPTLGDPPPFRAKTPLPHLKDAPSDHTKPKKRDQKTKAQILENYRKQLGEKRTPELALLKDCLYIIQGISGTAIHFTQTEDQRVVFSEDEQCIPQTTRQLIHRLAEAGHLYSRVASFVKATGDRTDAGMIEQSLAHHLQRQLTEYYRLVAILETELIPKQDSEGKELPCGLTLRRLEVWIDEWRLRLRMMSVSVEACREAQGGALVSLIHGYTDNGDPFIRDFTDGLLEDVSKPFFVTLQKWLFGGELHDPFSEFFVAINPEMSSVPHTKPQGLLDLPGSDEYGEEDMDEIIRPDADGGRRLWQDQYMFRKEMLPSFVDETFGKKIFSTGKSLNFIRYSCHDSDWVETRDEIRVAGRALRYSDIPGLERSIDAAYKVASQRLLSVFYDKFHLMDHLVALKHYLMLGYGDFADQLMESLGPSLSRPANTLYRHSLTAILEASIRASNAQNDPVHVLRRLDARMLEYSHGEIGWDVFTLEYKVDAPIDTVLDPDCMVTYMKIFNHLWKLKRIEVTLTQGWMRVAGGSRTFLKLPELQAEWHRIRVALSEMTHFARHLQAWSQLEVIECSWKNFQEFINRKEGDLDTLIEAHQTFLNRIGSKLHFRSTRPGREDQVLLQAQELFQIILQFRDAMDNFYNASLAEAARMDSKLDAIRGVVTNGDKSPNAENLSRIIRRVQGYASSFSEKVQSMVHNLQSHPDTDCRFLAVRLSFSDYYKSKSRLT